MMHALSKDYLDKALEKGIIKKEHFNKGEVIHFENDPCGQLEILIDGRIIVERIDEDGNLLTIRQFEPGDILGGNLIFSKSPYYPMTITALSSVTLYKLDKKLVFQLCKENETFLAQYLELISDYALVLGEKIKSHVKRPLKKRILIYLEHESIKQKSTIVYLSLSKKKLAEYFGVERTSLSRALQQLKTEGHIVSYDAKNITLRDGG